MPTDLSTTPMRILEVCNEFPPTVGGSETHNTSEVDFLRRRGHSVCVVVPRSVEAMRDAGCDDATVRHACAPYWNWPDRQGAPVYNIRERGRSTVFSLHRTVRRLSRRHGPFDVVVVHRAHYVPAFLTARRLVLTMHYMELVCPRTLFDYQNCHLDPSGHCACYRTRGLWRNLKWAGRKRLTRWAVDAVVTKYPHIYEKLRHSGIPAGKVHRVANWVDTARFGGRQRVWPGMPDDLPAFCRDASCVFGYLGRLSEDKSVVEMLQAFLQAAGRLDGARFVLAGDGEERAKLERLARASPFAERIRFVGAVGNEHVPAVLSFFDCGLKVSSYDNYSWSLLELMAAGVAVIAVDEPGIRGVIVDGETGLLCNSSVASIAEALCRAHDDRGMRQRVGAGARRRIEQDYSQRNLLAYESILQGDVAESARSDLRPACSVRRPVRRPARCRTLLSS